MIFNYRDFKTFLYHAKNAGKITSMSEWDGSNAIILRHDVDLDIEAAYRLALIEFECGVKSTFFILTTCHSYNPCSSINRRLLHEMTEMGFEIGLHFDPTLYEETDEVKLKQYVDKEAEILSDITRKPVRSISLHNPFLHGQYPVFEGYCNAYSGQLFSDDSYISDSRMDFRGKDPYEFVLNVKYRPVQVALHPVHFSENGDAYPDLFYRYLKNYITQVDRAFRVNSTYAAQMPMDLFSYLRLKQE